ncbi:MAG: MFS transporter [Chloroflexaceae bacterium]|nr:MFS transporter [Chloroflexaceae bacterium]
MNSYAAANFNHRQMNWLHASYGVGAMLGPIVMTIVLASGTAWQVGYLLIGALLAGLALCFGLTRRRWREGRPDEPESPESPQPVAMRGLLRRPLVWQSVALFFFYTGLEVTAGNWSFSLFTIERGIAEEVAGMWVGIYWASLTVGRFMFGFISERFSARAILRTSMLTVPVAVLVFWWGGVPLLSFLALALIGFMLAPIYP